MIHYIYKITFLCGNPEGRYYIGKRSTFRVKDGYTGSGNFCKTYFKKYGKLEGETYTKEILEYNSSKDANAEREAFYIGTLFETDPLCMNLCKGGYGGKTYERMEYHRKRLSEFRKEWYKNHPEWGKMTDSKRKNLSIALKGKMSGPNNPHYGVKVPEEQKIRQSQKMKGRHRVYRDDGTYYMSF